MNKTSIFFIVVFLVICIAIHLLTLINFPPVWRDDVFMSDPAWQFLKNGTFTTSLIGRSYGVIENDSYHSFYGKINLIPLVAVFKLFGCGPFQARLVSFLSGLFAALFTYLIGKRLFNSKVGAMGMMLLLISPKFLLNSHMARQEMMLTCFILMAIYIYLLAKDKDSSLLFLICGFISGIALDVHLNGIMLPIVLLALFLFNSRTKILRRINFYYYIGGVILAFVYWIISRAFPYRESCWQEWDYYLNYLKGFYPPILSGKNLFELLNWEFERYRYIRIYEIAFITIALMFGSSRRKAQDRHILSITILTFILLFTFLIAHKSTFYTIYLYPFFMLSVTSFSYLSKNKFKIIVGKAMVLMLVLFYMFQSGEILYQFKGSNYYKYIDEIKKFIQPGSGIAGQPTWWYGFYDTNRYYALSVVDIGRKGVASHIKKRDIRYLLIDEYWREHFPLGMKDFLRRECMLIGRLKDKFYGAESFSPSETYYKLDIYRVKGH